MELFGPSVSRSGQSIIDVDKALKNLKPSNKDAIERLKGLADEIKELPTPAEKSARVIEIFGRRLGPQLVELLSEGRVAIDDIGKRAENLGLVMSDTQFKVAKDVTDPLRSFSARSPPQRIRSDCCSGRPSSKPPTC